MEEVFDNSEDATEKDLLEYDKYKEQNKENIIQKFLYLNEQKLLKKNYILESVKDTILFPYVLEMEHLIGNIEGIAFTDEPTRILSRFFFPKINASIQQSQTDSFLDATNVALGVNDIFNTNYTIQDILKVAKSHAMLGDFNKANMYFEEAKKRLKYAKNFPNPSSPFIYPTA
jgi:hypothetical protein